MMASVGQRIVFSRFLTRSGDQAWDFAVPLTLVSLPGAGLKWTALYYLIVRVSQILLAPRIGAMIDRWPRLFAARAGISTQVGGMLVGLGVVWALAGLAGNAASTPAALALFTALCAAGIVSNLGALIMDIAVANDIVPTVIAAGDLGRINSRMRRVDLLTEVGSPLVAGALMGLSPASLPLLGFALVALWNVASFIPEYTLIRSVILEHAELRGKPSRIPEASALTLSQKLAAGWRDFARQPVMPAIVAYAFLWLSVLSPHGVLMAAFLKEGWQLSELTIGAFRAAGAVFGLGATVAFPFLERRYGVVSASRSLIVFQALTVGLAVAAFQVGQDTGWAFLGFVLLSRIGLYGFSIGETQIRQQGIAAAERGRVNGFAASVTSLASLGLYAAGALLPGPEQFGLLVVASGAFVATGALVFSAWSLGRSATRLSQGGVQR